MTQHLCHWPGCTVEVPPKLFACKPHWFALPKGLRAAIWQEYRPGQERDKNPSKAYLAVVDRAMKFAMDHDKARRLEVIDRETGEIKCQTSA